MKFILSLLFIFLISSATVFANTDYVLPYPSSMPGSKFYKLHKLFEKIEKYWYFGDFSSFHYDLKYSDRYLVEAKTLFEYKQYLLADQALKLSDNYFTEAKEDLKRAKFSKKSIDEKSILLESAGDKHREVLEKIKKETPDSFTWTPEKDSSTKLNLKKDIDNALQIRRYE